MPITRPVDHTYPRDELKDSYRINDDSDEEFNVSAQKAEKVVNEIIDSPKTSLRNSIRERVIEVKNSRESNPHANNEVQGVRTFEKTDKSIHLCPYAKCIVITAVAIHLLSFFGYCFKNWGDCEINAMTGIPK